MEAEQQEAQRRYTAMNWAVGLASSEETGIKTATDVVFAAGMFYDFILNGPGERVLN